jgi:hypothetical protein
MFCIKPWRRCRTRIRNLNAMGVRLDTSIRTGCIERGWWYLSGVLGVQSAFTNKWMKQRRANMPDYDRIFSTQTTNLV